ncbi:MAG: hypothetical protein JWQ48_15 [Conexibacter sp.]|jgi:major membrane immunogen (membrane-anchored lipoprotein)|nr:hypothetical protein [Conexibacter sp.]
MRVRLTGLVIAAVAAAALTGCGSSGSDKAAKKLQQTGTQLQQQGKALQTKAEQIRQDLKDGKITAEEADRQLRAGADQITTNARKAAGQAIDQVKQNSNVPDDVKKQLDAAQKQLGDPASK